MHTQSSERLERVLASKIDSLNNTAKTGMWTLQVNQSCNEKGKKPPLQSPTLFSTLIEQVTDHQWKCQPPSSKHSNFCNQFRVLLYHFTMPVTILLHPVASVIIIISILHMWGLWNQSGQGLNQNFTASKTWILTRSFWYYALSSTQYTTHPCMVKSILF